jgi:predicted RNase H-like HicB family nuclease
MKFTVTFDRDEDGVWVVECPAIPGCVSQGKTKEQAIENIRDAIKLCLEVRAERGMPLTIEVDDVDFEGRRSLLSTGRGIRRDRDDLPSLTELRIEMHRDFETPSR